MVSIKEVDSAVLAGYHEEFLALDGGQHDRARSADVEIFIIEFAGILSLEPV
jgi:hypothetical protein